MDNDGDLDLVVNNVNMESFVYKNNSDKLKDHNYIKLRFIGPDQNKFAIGTNAKVYYKDQIIDQTLIPSRGFQSSVDYPMTIGIGSTTKIDSIRIIWPDDTTQKLTNVAVNSDIIIDYTDATGIYKANNLKTNSKLLNEIYDHC